MLEVTFGGNSLPLTDTAIRSLTTREKPYKLFDGRGLYLLVQPSGGRWWRLKYRLGGKEKSLSLGTYPDVSLKRARQHREETRALVAEGIDPSVVRKAEQFQQDQTLEAVAREWFSKRSPSWAKSHSSAIMSRLERWVFPWLGSRATGEVSAAELLAMLRRIEERGRLETAHRVRGYCSQIFRYAIATQRAERDVAADLRGALQSPIKRHHAAITEPKVLGGLLRAIEGLDGTFVVSCALRLTPLLLVRPGELRHMEWGEVGREAGLWTIPGKKMKMGRDHSVPLANQALSILDELEPLTGGERYVFPANRGRGRPMSENTVNAALRRLGYGKDEVTAHGFRATARTLLDEVLGERPDIIEHQLAHAVRDPNGRAYNRTAHLPERRQMMQRWADYLDSLRQGAAVVPLQVRL